MAIADSSFIFTGLSAVPHPLILTNNNARNFGTTSARRTDDSDSDSDSDSTSFTQLNFPSLRVSNPLLARSVVSVLGLGFVDAGYSGDWSRIGAITKQTEGLLKIGAFLVVPFCVFLILSFSKETDSS